MLASIARLLLGLLARAHAEGLTAEQVSVDIQADTLVVRITAAGSADHRLDLPLFDKVDPAGSRWTLLRTKVSNMDAHKNVCASFTEDRCMTGQSMDCVCVC